MAGFIPPFADIPIERIRQAVGSPQVHVYDFSAFDRLPPEINPHVPGGTSNTDDTTYSWSPTTGETFIDGVGQGAPSADKIYETVRDGGGTDTYDLSNYTTNFRVDLRPGEWSSFSADQLRDLDASASGVHLARGEIFTAASGNNDPHALIENAIGGSGSDLLIGNQANNMLAGGAGDDILASGAGDDRLTGAAGNDALDGGAGNDSLDGGAGGSDTAVYVDALAGVTVNLGLQGAAQNTGGGGIDKLTNIENLIGSPFDDALTGNAGANSLKGLGGDDSLNGAAGNDVLTGDAGKDRLIGGPGNDSLDGGAGKDSFVFDRGFGKDMITGFVAAGAGHDTIDFSTSVFANFAALKSHMIQTGGNVVITVDGADRITLKDVTLASLTAADFTFHAGTAQAAPAGAGASAGVSPDGGHLAGGSDHSWLDHSAFANSLHLFG